MNIYKNMNHYGKAGVVFHLRQRLRKCLVFTKTLKFNPHLLCIQVTLTRMISSYIVSGKGYVSYMDKNGAMARRYLTFAFFSSYFTNLDDHETADHSSEYMIWHRINTECPS